MKDQRLCDVTTNHKYQRRGSENDWYFKIVDESMLKVLTKFLKDQNKSTLFVKTENLLTTGPRETINYY
jgi:hypothetical protein